MKIFKKYFLVPTIITLISLILIAIFGNVAMLFSVVILIILEITLSFDNAIVNAKVLENMNPKWQKRFINWGIWVAVFGTRVVLPILIVALVSGLSIPEILRLAIYDPKTYGLKLEESHYSIDGFGGIFLLLVALKYFIDDEKRVHWFQVIEKKLKEFAEMESIEIIFSLIILLGISYFVPTHQTEILVSGLLGCITFVLMQGITSKMDNDLGDIALSGFSLFMYLNLLDVAFSLDGVVGAFAISNNIVVIAVGLGVGAYFVRSFTLLMVKQHTLASLKYLEHGAHYAIFGLGICMLLSLIFRIPEALTGVIGLIFVSWSYFSSRKATK